MEICRKYNNHWAYFFVIRLNIDIKWHNKCISMTERCVSQGWQPHTAPSPGSSHTCQALLHTAHATLTHPLPTTSTITVHWLCPVVGCGVAQQLHLQLPQQAQLIMQLPSSAARLFFFTPSPGSPGYPLCQSKATPPSRKIHTRTSATVIKH